MRTVRHDCRAVAGDAGLRDEGVAGGVAVAGDVTGLLQPVQNVAGHRAKERRARLELRVEHAAKGIQVVTGDDRPGGRQPVDELRVAVVDDVKQIEASGKPGREPRIVPQAVRHPVDAPHPCRPTRPGNRAARRLQRGPDEGRHNRRGMLALQAIEEHVGDEIHARPPLFEVVSDDRDARGFIAGADSQQLLEELQVRAGDDGPARNSRARGRRPRRPRDRHRSRRGAGSPSNRSMARVQPRDVGLVDEEARRRQQRAGSRRCGWRRPEHRRPSLRSASGQTARATGASSGLARTSSPSR